MLCKFDLLPRKTNPSSGRIDLLSITRCTPADFLGGFLFGGEVGRGKS